MRVPMRMAVTMAGRESAGREGQDAELVDWRHCCDGFDGALMEVLFVCLLVSRCYCEGAAARALRVMSRPGQLLRCLVKSVVVAGDK